MVTTGVDDIYLLVDSRLKSAGLAEGPSRRLTGKRSQSLL